eukprot:TRINITY_DN8097_c0_g1_i1.p1 TRINITY_DN8097_c0_g1~~TRINITY_DN8097_c0_g1_i1.p1  ORF type:complete len:346 (-),score=96.24 TRINITY_DN8097_c0_g1_i1:326-1363(-)
MKIILCLLVILGLAVATKSDYCGNNDFRNSTQVSECVNNIQHASFESGRFKALDVCLKSSDLGFLSSDIVKMISSFNFVGEKKKAVDIMQPYMLGLTCKDCAALLNNIGFSSDELDVLKVVTDASLIIDLEDKDTVVDVFGFSSDKAKARAMLVGQPKRSCLFGKITRKHFVVVMDVSGSMSTNFKFHGTSYSRLSYVKEELVDLVENSLATDQYFDVLEFSSSYGYWAQGLQQATSSNVQSAGNYISSLSAGGGTNFYDTLYYAMQIPNLEAVYFLSDGYPTVGETDLNDIIHMVGKLSAAHKIPVHTAAFLQGESDPETIKISKKSMSGIAQVSGGTFKCLLN